ncbi:NAD(P)H-binding protein [uncultured Rothia sp.]|uniref:NAD(P)-dependent oxidoreductase n=1 Tax=uncultured Rothia sp. TaxID=316088 RepID=UPI0028DC1F1F|nr:NAD(P)H-binding protein [uncultured Rothia sp.]
MNIAIIGATGMVGARTAAEAVSRGHQVDAYTRSGKAPEGTTAHSIDLADTAALVDIVNNHDVTIIAVSAGRGTSAQPVIDAHRALIAAAPAGRLLVVGGAGSLVDGNGNRFVDSEGFPEEYKPEAKAFAQVLDEYRASEGLNWTLVSPAFEIAPGERTGKYNTALDTPAGASISAEDFAVALIDEAEEPKHPGRRFTVAN